MAKRHRCPTARTGCCDDDHCRGWEWFNDSEIERCDTCRRFPDDEAAALHVQGCAPCRAHLAASGGTLTIRGTGLAWDELRLCKTGEPGCWHGHCLTCGDSECGLRPGVYPKPHRCTGLEHDHTKERS